MKKIKILYTIPNFDTAGSGKVLYDLAKGLDPNKFEVHIACSHFKGAYFKTVEELGLPIHEMETTVPLRPYWNLLKRIYPYQKFIKEHGFDIVHSWHWSSDWSEVLGARVGGAKFVYTKKAMTWGAVHWKIRSYLANYIITINAEMRDYFPKKRQQKLIPLGIDTEYYSPDYFCDLRNSEIFTIITVANLVPVKGIEVLIEAVELLHSKDIQIQILGDERSNYAKKIKEDVLNRNLGEKIVFLGKHVDVRPFLAQANLYVIPTLNAGRKEGMPMALVEAMSMGVPVLGSDISGINFVLKDFKNYLFEAGDSHGLAEKIEKFKELTTVERFKIGQDLRHYVVTSFNMDVFVKAHEELYESLHIN
ncbi:glycosyltransferase [Winogradskyella undariae]|uniref:glycosyltransferase n=1 Tax=Winogradskyella undariae TaxID=1285465 RepID=UPI0015CC0505|nr:glycosyltransferase [Winogradskyella undariae]